MAAGLENFVLKFVKYFQFFKDNLFGDRELNKTFIEQTQGTITDVSTALYLSFEGKRNTVMGKARTF